MKHSRAAPASGTSDPPPQPSVHRRRRRFESQKLCGRNEEERPRLEIHMASDRRAPRALNHAPSKAAELSPEQRPKIETVAIFNPPHVLTLQMIDEVLRVSIRIALSPAKHGVARHGKRSRLRSCERGNARLPPRVDRDARVPQSSDRRPTDSVDGEHHGQHDLSPRVLGAAGNDVAILAAVRDQRVRLSGRSSDCRPDRSGSIVVVGSTAFHGASGTHAPKSPMGLFETRIGLVRRRARSARTYTVGRPRRT